jgi:hypothetical protein
MRIEWDITIWNNGLINSKFMHSSVPRPSLLLDAILIQHCVYGSSPLLVRFGIGYQILQSQITLFLSFSDRYHIRIVIFYLLSVSDQIQIINFRIFTYEKLSESDTILHYPIVFDGYFRIRIVVLIFL